jgi:hypothetical protein
VTTITAGSCHSDFRRLGRGFRVVACGDGARNRAEERDFDAAALALQRMETASVEGTARRFEGLGRSPPRMIRLRRAPGSGSGTADNSATV